MYGFFILGVNFETLVNRNFSLDFLKILKMHLNRLIDLAIKWLKFEKDPTTLALSTLKIKNLYFRKK